jgi:hypothetical protein
MKSSCSLVGVQPLDQPMTSEGVPPTPANANPASKVGIFARFAVLLRSAGDLVLQVAGLMIAAELTQRGLVQLKQNVAELLGFGSAGCKTPSVNFSQRAD